MGGNPVARLTAAHIDVTDNGVPQSVDRVPREDVPLNLMLVLGSSGSLAGAALVDAAQGLMRALRPEDRVGALAFSRRIDLPMAPTVRHAEVQADEAGAVVRRSGAVLHARPAHLVPPAP